MRYGVIFVTYYPDKEFLEKICWVAAVPNLKVCVVDNTPDEAHEMYDKMPSGVVFHQNNNSGGIAGAFNIGIRLIRDRVSDGFFTFDQDSDIPHDFFVKSERFLERFPMVKIACPNFFDVNSRTYATFAKLNKFTYCITDGPTTDFAISSGLYISWDAYRAIGDFDDRLLIDHVDTDYCLRASIAGIDIHINYDCLLRHRIGIRSKRRLFGLTWKPNNHNALRRFYIGRNGTYLSIKYFNAYPSFFFMNLMRIVHEVVCISFFEAKKLQKLRAIAVGCLDGMRGRLGVCPYDF